MRRDPHHIGIWGRTLSGKSTRAKLLLRDRVRVVVFDPLDEYSDVAPIGAASMGDVLAAIDRNWRGRFGIRFVPSRSVDPVDALDGLARLLGDVQEPYQQGRDDRHVTLMVDELAASAPNTRRPRSSFNALCSRGRHYGIELIGASQRMAEVTPTFRGNTTEDYFFPLRSAADYDEAAKLIGRQWLPDLKALEPHNALHYAGGVVEKTRNPARR
ncbi:helicase HerA domain-containing protein [Arenibaculum sp.]|jgi:hypothetical protein|uniref:helicase HerA domain-containing protein n=1 Tax=Arenibaculum sp. TaxID=2865862 RepID=UPI002E11C0E5|nr:DUF87 domain-containing protein [Arenibaculum sp.]